MGGSKDAGSESLSCEQVSPVLFHGCWQKTGESWVRDKGHCGFLFVGTDPQTPKSHRVIQKVLCGCLRTPLTVLPERNTEFEGLPVGRVTDTKRVPCSVGDMISPLTACPCTHDTPHPGQSGESVRSAVSPTCSHPHTERTMSCKTGTEKIKESTYEF